MGPIVDEALLVISRSAQTQPLPPANRHLYSGSDGAFSFAILFMSFRTSIVRLCFDVAKDFRQSISGNDAKTIFVETAFSILDITEPMTDQNLRLDEEACRIQTRDFHGRPEERFLLSAAHLFECLAVGVRGASTMELGLPLHASGVLAPVVAR